MIAWNYLDLSSNNNIIKITDSGITLGNTIYNAASLECTTESVRNQNNNIHLIIVNFHCNSIEANSGNVTASCVTANSDTFSSPSAPIDVRNEVKVNEAVVANHIFCHIIQSDGCFICNGALFYDN